MDCLAPLHTLGGFKAMPSNDYSVPSHFIKSDGFSMDNPNQSPRNEYQPISEERRRFLEEKYKRRNLAPESLAIRPELRKLHIATIIFAFGLGGYFALYADFGEKETVFSPIRRYYRRKANEFWSLSEEEKKQLKEQGRL